MALFAPFFIYDNLKSSITIVFANNYFSGVNMKLIKTTLAMTLTGFLVACGGGGSDGYYNTDSSNGTGSNQPNPNENITPADAQKIFNALKIEAASLFGQADPQKKRLC